jgi:hypothetical protein
MGRSDALGLADSKKQEPTMTQERHVIDEEALARLEDRLKRGIPKWEQADFIEMIVPQLVARLQKYLKFEIRS